MIINIAGFNVDFENIKKVDKIQDLKLNWTPETISASYARISRDPRNIDELRKEAREEVDKARRSNTNIIFEMGHSSIAEHAVFNIDIIGVSRLLSEELEKSRLVSFTEKSQRYIKIGTDFLIPKEFNEDPNFLDRYKKLINNIFQYYNNIVTKLEPYFLEKYRDKINKREIKERDVLNFAKEDARYILPLSVLTQLGMTVNARNLENILRKFFSSNINEFNEFANNIYSQIKHLTPSLIKYTEPTLYDKNTYNDIKNILNIKVYPSVTEKEVELIDYDCDFIDNIISAFIVKTSFIDYKKAKDIVKNQRIEWKNSIIREAIRHLTKHSSLKREFELANFRFNLLISATAFAQLKRHRMATIIDGEYSPELGIKLPHSIKENGLEDLFMEIIKNVETLYYEAKNRWGSVGDYILTNSHRKNIILQANFRELTHITRLRSDIHAQWDIREISNKIIEEIERVNRFISKILCGKDKFDVNFKEI